MSGFGRGGGRGGVAKRGSGRGGMNDRRFSRPIDRPVRGGPNHGTFDGSRSPDRRNNDNGHDMAPARFNSFRRRFSPSPDRLNRSPSPPHNQYNESGRSGARDDGNESRRNNADKVVAQSGTVQVGPKEQKTEDQEAREFKVRLFDADEEIRRAEFQLRRAKMIRSDLCDEYNEFLARCVNQQKSEAKKTPNW